MVTVFCVLDTQDIKKIPDLISFFDANTSRQVKFQCRFCRQSWYCRRCNTEHTAHCDKLKRFYERRDVRAKQTIETLIVSDSTLRLADEVGLSADVVCVPGSFLGPPTELVELAVVNEIVDIGKKMNDLSVFRSYNEAGLRKLEQVVDHHKLRQCVIMEPALLAGISKDQRKRRDKFAKLINEFVGRKTLEELRIYYFAQPQLHGKSQDPVDSDHPSKKGTLTLLENHI